MKRLIWSLWRCVMSIASARNMAIALISSLCSGLACGFALRPSLSAGAGSSPSPITCWCWLATSQEPRCTRGKTASASPLCNRCVARCANCCHSWAPLLDSPTLAENRRDEQRESRLAEPSAFQSFGRGRKYLPWCPGEQVSRLLIEYWLLSQSSSAGSGRAF